MKIFTGEIPENPNPAMTPEYRMFYLGQQSVLSQLKEVDLDEMWIKWNESPSNGESFSQFIQSQMQEEKKTLRLVRDGAKEIIEFGNHIAFCYDKLDTIPIESPWTVDEAAVLLNLSNYGLKCICHYHTANFVLNPCDVYMSFPDVLRCCISLSLAHSKSGLSLEDFIEELRKCNTEKSQ